MLIIAGLYSTFTTTCSVTPPKRCVCLFIRYLQWEGRIYPNIRQGRVAEVCLADVPWTQIRSCGSRYFRRGRQAVSVWYDFSNTLRKSGNTLLALLHRVTRTGGEFSSLYQNSFHHYRDFWCFDVSSQSWDRIDTKVRPTARSGHRYVKPVAGGMPPLL